MPNLASMKKPSLILAIALGTLILAPPAHAVPSTTERRIEEVRASFRYRVDGDLVQYEVHGRRVFDAKSGELLRRWIYAGVIPCERHDSGVTCEGSLYRQSIRRFTVADDMQRMELLFARAGQRSRLVLEAGPSYDASGREVVNDCGGTTTYEYEYAYNAIAQGRLLGRAVHSQKDRARSLEHMERYVKTIVCP